MRGFLRFVITCLVGLSVAASIGLAPLRAEAVPSPAAGHHGTVIVSSTVVAYTKLANAVHLKTRSKTLDYRTAEKVFKANKKYGTTWRRSFAAGWLTGKGKIIHISSGEMNKLRTVIRSTLRQMAPNCRGETKFVLKDKYKYDRPAWYYYDSCDTNILIRNYTFCTFAGGIVALLGPPGVAIGGITAAICGGIGAWISTAQSNSDVSAIIVQAGPLNPYQKEYGPKHPVRYQIGVAVEPQ